MDWQLLWIVLGLVLVIEGLPYFLFPERALRTLRQLERFGPETLRMLGLAALVLGTVLLLVGRWVAG